MTDNQTQSQRGPAKQRQRGVLRGTYLATMTVALATGLWAQQPGAHHDGPGPGQMRGMMGEGRQDMETIHALFGAHQKISRSVKMLDNGVETITESSDPKVQALIREHVGAMYQRLSKGQPIRMWDPLYAEIFRQAGKIKMEMSNTEKGIKVSETSTDAWVVKLLHSHANGVSEFVDQGMAVMHKEHPLPTTVPDPAVEGMRVLTLRTSVGAGKDKEVETLFQGPGRKLVQITLRNHSVLESHKATVPITIQCVAGSGVLKVGDGVKAIELTPGVLVTIEANVLHEIQAKPNVSILLTQFTAKP